MSICSYVHKYNIQGEIIVKEKNDIIELEPDDDCVISTLPDTETLYDLAELFKVFGDSTRIRILAALIEKEMCVYHLSQELEMGQSAISHQLRVLRGSGLVKARRNGKEMLYSLDDDHVKTIFAEGLEHILHKNR